MTLDDVKRLIALEGPALHACGVTALYVFGSVANGNAGPTSETPNGSPSRRKPAGTAIAARSIRSY